MPSPVRAETGRIGAPARAVGARAAVISAVTAARRAGSARSALVRATAPRGEAEQVEDRQVLGGLRHRAVVGGDDEQREVDAAGAGEHGVDQPLVAGDVDEAGDRARRCPRSA